MVVVLIQQKATTMKKLTLQLALVIGVLFSIHSTGNAASIYTSGLKISSFLTYHGERMSDYTIIIYKNGTGVDTMNVNGDNSVKFFIDFDADYCVRFIKKGYYDRVVLVNTRIPESYRNDFYKFDFEIEMISDKSSPNTLADMPVALVQYDQGENDFINNRDYFRQIRGKEIKEEDEESAVRE
jgi:hypothetical protein